MAPPQGRALGSMRPGCSPVGSCALGRGFMGGLENHLQREGGTKGLQAEDAWLGHSTRATLPSAP